MTSDRAEKLATLFLAIFSTALAAQLAVDGALRGQGLAGAAVACLGSVALAVAVRVWPQPAAAAARQD
jgi:hypothetical protein